MSDVSALNLDSTNTIEEQVLSLLTTIIMKESAELWKSIDYLKINLPAYINSLEQLNPRG